MSVLHEFVKERGVLLRPPIGSDDAARLARVAPCLWEEAAVVFELFDGEVDWGALLPGLMLMGACELLKSTELISSLVEDELLPESLSGFCPWITTSLKTDIGLMPKAGAFPGFVVELDYESGTILPLATSFTGFVDAYFSLSLRLKMDEGVRRAGRYQVSDADIAYLKTFTGICAARGDPAVEPLELSAL